MYDLIDAEERSRHWSGTFAVPPAENRNSLEAGTFVKLGFISPPNGNAERMWVVILTKNPDGAYVGVLVNTPCFEVGIQQGETLTFEAKHIFEIMPPKEAQEQEGRESENENQGD